MKLKSFHIINFGGLHDYDYTFEDGLNVILHDNGWGKTTMAAFLKAMLYGFDTKRSKDITENERRRYLPWQGGEYGGSLDFEADGVNYRIHRTFGETPRFDKTKIVNLDTHTTARIDPDKIGETLFKLDANAFQRSIFITQNGLSIDGAASSIHTRLNTLVSQANDVGAFDNAVSQLNQEIKVYEKTGNRGKIGDISKLIAEKERQKDRMEASIKEQAEARKRIVEIDQSLVYINKTLAEKRKQLEEISGDLKKKEAAKKLLSEIDTNIQTIQQKMDAIAKDFDGRIPESKEVEFAKNQNRVISNLADQMKDLNKELISLQKEHSDLLSLYENEMPAIRDIDEIQRMYGELQGILSTGKEEITKESHPEEYRQISSVIETNPDYTSKLENVISLQDSISSTARRLEAKENEIKHETDSWDEKKTRYSGLHTETVELKKQLDEISQYKPETINPVIYELENQEKEERELLQKLSADTKLIDNETVSWKEKQKRYQDLKEDSDTAFAALQEYSKYSEELINPVIEQLASLQKNEQAVDLKERQLKSNQLTEKDTALLKQYPNHKDTYNEGKQVLDIYHSLSSKNAELTGLQNVLAGENSKTESYRSSLAQYAALSNDHFTVISEPKKSSGSLLIGIGAVLTIAGLALAFTMSMALIALAVIGMILIILGITNNNKYKTDVQRYEEYQTLSKERAEAEKKRDGIQEQLNTSESRIDALTNQIQEIKDEINRDQTSVNNWLLNYGQTSADPEASIRFVMDQAEKAGKLAEQKNTYDLLKTEVASEKTEIEHSFDAVKDKYPETSGKTISEAINLLRGFTTEYKVRKEKQSNAAGNLERFLQEYGLSDDQIKEEQSPLISKMGKTIEDIRTRQIKLRESRIQYDLAYPEIEGKSYEKSLETLRQKRADYSIAKTKYTTAVSNEEKFVRSSGMDRESFLSENSPRLKQLSKEKDKLVVVLNEAVDTCNKVLESVNLSLNGSNAATVLRQANEILRIYNEEERKISESSARSRQKQDQISSLKNDLKEKSSVLKNRYAEKELPARLSLIREDIQKEADLRKQISTKQTAITENQKQYDTARKTVDAFKAEYIKFTPETANVFDEVDAKIAEYNTLKATLKQTEAQKKSVIEQNKISSEKNNGETEQNLRYQIQIEEKRRDDLRDEYMQKTDLIRQADQAATVYPDIVTEIHELYEQKQKAQNRVSMLKHTVQLITKAKENLADRYLSKVEQLFNNYMHIWLDNDAVRGILDIDFNVRIEEDDKVHVAEGYSTGYCDLIDFCMRLALVDTLFEKEQPFLVLDDPFVNLDADRLDKALELINIMGINKQIIYFVCHPIRAVETNVNETVREEYVKLAESTKKMLESRKAAPSIQKKTVYKSPKERYQIVPGKTCYIDLVKPGKTITNSIFGLDFKVKEDFSKDITYELFFIDEKGHVLNERQILEVNDGELSNSRIQFSLNTRDDSGKEYELMIRESGQDNYDIVARIPFAAKLAFTGTFAFDF